MSSESLETEHQKYCVTLYCLTKGLTVIFITRLTSHVQQGRTIQVCIAYDNWHTFKVDQIYCVTFLKEKRRRRKKRKLSAYIPVYVGLDYNLMKCEKSFGSELIQTTTAKANKDK